jgi:hypothetical protein
MPGKSAPFIERMSPMVPASAQVLLSACMCVLHRVNFVF